MLLFPLHYSILLMLEWLTQRPEKYYFSFFSLLAFELSWSLTLHLRECFFWVLNIYAIITVFHTIDVQAQLVRKPSENAKWISQTASYNMPPVPLHRDVSINSLLLDINYLVNPKPIINGSHLLYGNCSIIKPLAVRMGITLDVLNQIFPLGFLFIKIPDDTWCLNHVIEYC